MAKVGAEKVMFELRRNCKKEPQPGSEAKRSQMEGRANAKTPTLMKTWGV